MANKSSVGIFGGKSQPKIIFFLQTETAPEMSYEISERELFRRLLSEKTAKEVGDAQQNETSNILKGIDLKSTISQVETHKSRNVGHIESENIFVVFQTTSSKENRQYWWSLEESTESVAMQRSKEKSTVINKFKGKIRNQVETIADGLKGKGSIKDFLILLWIHIVIDLKCQSFLSRCESFIPLVMKKMTETFYEYPPNYFTYSALSSEEINPQVEEIINFLTKVTKWHPLLCLTYLGDIHQFDRVLGNGFFKSKIDGIYNRLTLLNAAILFCKTGMVKHVLEKKKANARKRDQAGRNALNMAALFTDEEEIIKLLLTFQFKDKLNIKDKSGMTAFHYAVISSNLTVARHLIDHGADFRKMDPTGHSPLHLAAHYAKDNQILELLLTKVNIDECDSAGITALHSAAIASNAISARYLIERGADINRRDKRGRTTVHVAAALAKNMDFFNIFLSNEKADLECCDERKLTVLAYAKINQFGLAKEIVSGIEKKINDKRSEYSLAKKTAGVQPCTGGEYKHTSIFGNPMENITGGINVMGKYSQKFKSTRNLTGGEYKKTLLFVPDADNEPHVVHEISEPALFQFVLNEETLEEFKGAEVEIAKMLDVLKDIDKQSKITQVEAYHSSRKKMTDALKAYHVFIVFKSTSEKADDGVYWWSLEKHTEYIVLQRSRNKDNVKNKLHGKERIKVKSIKEDLKGKGTIKDLFAILWAHQVIPEKYNIFCSNCQFLVSFVGEQITEIGYKYKGYFKYYPSPEKGRDKQMLELINVIRDCSDWSPLFHLIKMGNTDLVDKTVASGMYDINAFHNGLTPLHLAIMLNKTKMVQHLLQPPMNADPTKRDASGKSALLLAVDMYEMKEEIFDLLLAHDKVNVDDVDEDGQTALHLAARKSNIFQKLLERGANPNIFDKIGRSPLHVAALDRDGIPVIDLLLAHPKVKVDDVNEFGITALHAAAYASNVIAVKRLIEKGANPNLFDKDDLSPLHVAALQKNGNPMIDLLLEAQKVKGLGDVNNQNKQGRTALHYAAAYSNEITTEHLIEKGADLHCRTNVGDTPLHYAALGAKDMNTIDLLLENINEGEIEQYKNDERLFFFARHNSHGLEVGIIDRLRKKDIGLIPPSTETDDCWTGESDEATGVNTRRFVLDKGADPSIDLTGFDGLDFLITRVKISLGIYDDINGRDQNGETPLFSTIRANNVNAVRNLLEKGADPTIRNNKGETPFHVAVENCRDFDILNLLLGSGKVDINEITSEYGETALHIAVMGSNKAAAEFLLSKGANPNVADKDGATPLHLAVWFAKGMDIFELLVNHPDVDVNCLDKWGQNALDKAKFYNAHGHGERIANLLKEKGAMEREDRLFKGNNESLKKLVNYTSSNAADEIENVLSDATVPFENQIARIKDEHLVSAIEHSDLERVRLLLKNGADISSARGEDGMNAFHVASRYAKTTDLIDVILETGKFDINGVDNDGRTPLHWAIMGTNLETIAHHLIQKGADPTITDKEGNTALHFAALHAKTIETITLILENKQVDINHRDELGRTALHYAIEKKNVEIVRCLVEKGADPTIHDHTGYTPFHFAAYFLTDTDVLGLLLETGIVDINETTSKEGLTALHLEIIKYNVPALRFLLSKGANPNVGDENGITPLHLVATLAKDIDIVELFLNHPDTNVNCLDNEGRNALDYANDNEHGHSERLTKLLKEKDVVSQTGNSLEDEKVQKEITFKNNVKGILAYAIENSDVEKVRILIEKGAEISTVTWGEEGVNALHVASVYAKKTELLDVILAAGQFEINGSNVNGMTALHYASHANNMTTARYLLEKGADPAIGDNKGFTPLHLAAKHSYNTDILALLLTREKKIEINKVNESGLTALYVAVATSNVTAARFLLEKGANPNVADPNGYIPLHVAAKYAKDMDIVELLLNHKDTNVNFLDNAGRNALDFAMDNEHGLGKAIVNLLREKMAAKAEGSKHELENIATSIPPSRIIKNSDIEKIRFLIENGQDISAMTWGENGTNALHLAAADEKAAEFIDVILETGKFDINGVDNDGRTPLHYAIERPNPVTINARRLIKMGANTNIADKNGVTPLHMAARNAKSMDLIEILLNTEAVDVNCVDIKGRTPLSCARDNIHGLGQRIVHRLKEYGAMR
jgi:ankyrin repeat protein